MPKEKCGIIGVGMVGGALAKVLDKPILYDKYKKIGSLKELDKADIIFVCVPTPYESQKGGFDLSYVKDVFKIIKGNKIIVIKSTVLPGTTEIFQKKYPQHKILFNPEFLTEVTADQDMRYPDRQLVGYTKKSYGVAGHILQLLPLAPFEKIISATEAEMAKYYGNCWFGVKVVYANQIYDFCHKLGIDYNQVMECAAADKRIGRSHLEIFHKGYRGYGGKCIPKDIKAFIRHGDRVGVDLRLLKTTDEINDRLLKDGGYHLDR